ncbi:serine-threonine protein kinase, putative [Entamoeba invadens IP1]|uniref:Serine-threonine protein kinase, putative n=1 Tax=Entamoeba invadens IP1 TaxID=370355 RepID=A0A0A1U2Z1_ENTIV|nr:serine-threonine protein kinase, putative [Entamoeba invadens IP1]ELP88417.1 serine-threonine protein kinase, putative [Entamoeba invadens IP1]|eukprot:XP_004255188.1 serine-threonine protein kinase, putative [Entamoeba invadens IP1]
MNPIFTPESVEQWFEKFSHQLPTNIPQQCKICFETKPILDKVPISFLGIQVLDNKILDTTKTDENDEVEFVCWKPQKKAGDFLTHLIKVEGKTIKVKDFITIECDIPPKPKRIASKPDTMMSTINFIFTFLKPSIIFNIRFYFEYAVPTQSEHLIGYLTLRGLTEVSLVITKAEFSDPDPRDVEIFPDLIRKKTLSFVKRLDTFCGQSVIYTKLLGQDQESKALFDKQKIIHQSMRCPQIALCLNSVDIDNALVFEFPNYGTMTHFLNESEKSGKEISRVLKYKFCQDIAKAMEFLQSSQIVHRDLRCDSVFVFSVDENDVVNCKLGDICSCERISKVGTSKVTPPLYSNQNENFRMPPEITSIDASYTTRCDVYSYGVLVFHIITELLSTNPIGEGGTVLPQFARLIPFHITNIINNCCAMNDTERPMFTDLVSNFEVVIKKAKKDTAIKTITEKPVEVPLV